jgi:hypothetical protein
VSGWVGGWLVGVGSDFHLTETKNKTGCGVVNGGGTTQCRYAGVLAYSKLN